MSATASPFRELFVELPAALIEALRVSVEETLRDTQQPAPTPARQRRSDLDALRHSEWAIMGVFGWTEMQSVAAPAERSLLIAARLHCGHRVRYELTEQAVAATSVADVLAAAVGAKPRACFCVPDDARAALR